MTALTVPTDDPRVQALVDLLQAEYVEMYGEPDPNPVGEGVAALYLREDTPLAVGMWQWRSSVVGEIRRMFTVPSHRGNGAAPAVLRELERSAREHGIRQLILESGPKQQAAHAVYREAGYRPIPPYGHYIDNPGSVFLGRVIQ